MAQHPSPFVWNSNGQMQAPIIWVGTVTTTSGTWSINYSDAGFTSAPTVYACPILNDADVYDRAYASLSGTPSTTSASGYVCRAANLLVLGATARTVPDGTVVHIMAIGDTM